VQTKPAPQALPQAPQWAGSRLVSTIPVPQSTTVPAPPGQSALDRTQVLLVAHSTKPVGQPDSSPPQAPRESATNAGGTRR
jgi:hypothetical protein